LICITLALLFFPAPILHHKARKWFLYSHVRARPNRSACLFRPH
jgi:hypothetical protein